MSTYLFTHDWAGEEERLGGVCTPSSIPVPSGRSSRSPSALASMVRMGEAFRSLDGTGGPATRLAAAANCRFPSRRRRRLGRNRPCSTTVPFFALGPAMITAFGHRPWGDSRPGALSQG